MKRVIYRPAYRDEWEACMDLALRTFMRFEAPEYTPEGVRNFYKFIKDDTLRVMFDNGGYHVMVADMDGDIVGMISLRNDCHISLLFVDEEYHRRGIGRGLVEGLAEYMRIHMGRSEFTVNSSPYAVEFYHRVGFIDTDVQQMADGITYTPMILRLEDI